MIAKTEPKANLQLANVQSIHHPVVKLEQVSIDILRLDKIHPIISGNKWFKLKYSLEDALSQKKKSIVTVGGAYSNHILASACACKEIGLTCFGLIKGEKPKRLSCTLEAAIDFGMEIVFIPRALFQQPDKLLAYISNTYKESFLIEEGGKNENGIRGAEEILKLVELTKYDYICCSIGTGTMMAGMVRASLPDQHVTGISSLKISDSENELSRFLESTTHPRTNYTLVYDYHFGGYAKNTRELFHFMNDFYIRTSIPTDFVYTGKLIFGVLDLLKRKYFQPGKAILIIHSGGLQGNCSLPEGTLLF